MMNTDAKATTKKDMKAVAAKARRHGHYRPDMVRQEVYVFCPQCREQVWGFMTIDLTTFRRKTVTRALDEGMMAHLPHCGEE